MLPPDTVAQKFSITTNFYEITKKPDTIHVYKISFGRFNGEQVKARGLKNGIVHDLITRGILLSTSPTTLPIPVDRHRPALATDFSRLVVSTAPLAPRNYPPSWPTHERRSFPVDYQAPAAVQTSRVNVWLERLPDLSPDVFDSWIAGGRIQNCQAYITALNLLCQSQITKQAALTNEWVKIGRNKYFPMPTFAVNDMFNLDQVFEGRRGMFLSARPAPGRTLLNVNLTSSAFYREILLSEFQGPIGRASIRGIESLLRGVQVRLTFTPPNTNSNTTGYAILLPNATGALRRVLSVSNGPVIQGRSAKDYYNDGKPP